MHKRSLDKELLTLAHNNLLPMLGVNLAAAFGATLILARNNVEWAWYFLYATLVISSIRLLMWFRFNKMPNAALFNRRTMFIWRHIYSAGLLFAATSWAVVISLCIHSIAREIQYPIIVIISALAGGATAVTAPLKTEARIYIAILLLPMSFCMAFATPPDLILALLGVLFYIGMLFIHSNNHKIVKESIVLRNQNRALINDLENINATLEDKVNTRTLELQRIANKDSLTDIANRRGLMEWMTANISATATEEAAILFLDLDRFKQINDAKGHEIGDQILKMATMRFSDTLPNASALARWGGDEFIIVIPQQSNARHLALDLAERLIEVTNVLFDVNGEQLGLGLSIGIAYYPTDATTYKEVIHAADLASAEVKRVGRGQALSFKESFAEIQRYRFDISRALANAITSNELAVVYQPIIDAATGNIAAFETLARWTHPVIGPINPADFVRLAEETDRIATLGEWVLQKACSDAAQWPHQAPAPKVAVNVSVKQLLLEDFSARVARILSSTGLPARRLALEMTESLFDDEHMDVVLNTVKELRAMGIEIHIDDFGTGYSSLSRLHQFPVTSIKIDRSFVMQIHNHGHVIIESAIFIAQNFNLKVIAEGVETPEQARQLYAMGVDFFQGYHFGRPNSDVKFEKPVLDWQDGS